MIIGMAMDRQAHGYDSFSLSVSDQTLNHNVHRKCATSVKSVILVIAVLVTNPERKMYLFAVCHVNEQYSSRLMV